MSQPLESLPKSSEPPPWWPAAEKQFQALAALADNWDGDGASALDPKLVEAARKLLRALVAEQIFSKPHIYPTRSGGVQLEWERGERYFEIEVVSPTAVELYYVDGHGEQVEKDVKGLAETASLLSFIDDVEKA
jgi:hypothetical protein